MFKGHSPLFVNPNHYGFSMLVSYIHGFPYHGVCKSIRYIVLHPSPFLFTILYFSLLTFVFSFPGYWRWRNYKHLIKAPCNAYRFVFMFVSIAFCGEDKKQNHKLSFWTWKCCTQKFIFTELFSLQSLEEDTWKFPMKAMLCYDLYNVKDLKVVKRRSLFFCWQWSTWNFCAICIVAWDNSKR